MNYEMSNCKQGLLKHKYSISGKEYTRSVDRKRNRSKEDCEERKRGRKDSETDADTDTSTDSETRPTDFEDTVTDQREREDLQETDEMEEERFIHLFATALKNEEISGLMTKAFNSAIDKKLKPVVENLAKLKIDNETRDRKVQQLEEKCLSMEARIDEYEQSKRDRNVIISGLSEDKCCQEGVIEFFNTIPGITVSILDIDYVLKLRTPRTTNSNIRSNRVRVVMKEKAKKVEIMTSKKQLKKKDNKWVNDDLTPFRSKLQYLARQCVKTGSLSQTWTYDGKIFIKKQADAVGKQITSTKDLPDVVPQI